MSSKLVILDDTYCSGVLALHLALIFLLSTHWMLITVHHNDLPTKIVTRAISISALVKSSRGDVNVLINI